MSLLGVKDNLARRSGIVTVLDVGSSKVCCVVAKLQPEDVPRWSWLD